jgi:hypothetical protein
MLTLSISYLHQDRLLFQTHVVHFFTVPEPRSANRRDKKAAKLPGTFSSSQEVTAQVPNSCFTFMAYLVLLDSERPQKSRDRWVRMQQVARIQTWHWWSLAILPFCLRVPIICRQWSDSSSLQQLCVLAIVKQRLYCMKRLGCDCVENLQKVPELLPRNQALMDTTPSLLY